MLELRRTSLVDVRYTTATDAAGDPRQRRVFVPRAVIETQLRAFLADNLLEVPDDAFARYTEAEVYYAWLECLTGRGITTVRYGALPVILVGILERSRYDPMGEVALPTEVIQRWEPV